MNKKLYTGVLAAGLMLGGVGAASAYDGSGTAGSTTVPNAAEASSASTGTSSATSGGVITVQDPDGAQQEVPAEGEADQQREGRHGRKGCGLDTAAAAIGIEVDELRAALDNGDSIADVAEANGVDPEEVIDAMLAAAEERLDGKVEAGRLTEAEADEKLAEKTDRIEAKVNGVDTTEV